MTTEFIPVLSGIVLLFLPPLGTPKRRIISAILLGAAASALGGELSATVVDGIKAILFDAGLVYCIAATGSWISFARPIKLVPRLRRIFLSST